MMDAALSSSPLILQSSREKTFEPITQRIHIPVKIILQHERTRHNFDRLQSANDTGRRYP